MTDQGAKWTDAQIAALERRVREVYQEAVADMTEKLNRFIRKFKRDEKELKAKLERGEISEADYRDWLAGQVFQGKRWRQQRDDLADTLTHASEIAADIINDATPGAFAYNANWAAFEIERAGNANMGFEIYDTSTVKRLLRDQPNLLPPSRVDIPKERRWNMQNITRQITQGIIQGEALDTIAKRLQRAATMDFNQARTHARTAMTYAQNSARLQRMIEAEDMGINIYKEWVATLDSHTRHAHAVLDGQRKRPRVPFTVGGKNIMEPGDQRAAPELVYNCRCCLVSYLPDYEDENAQRRDNENRVNISNMTFAEWAGWKKSLQKENNKNIMNTSTKAAGSDGVQIIGKLNLDLYRRFFPNVTTEEVVITQERVAHVLAHHPQEENNAVFDRLFESVQNPNYLVKDTAPNTTIVLRRFPEQNEQYRIILRLHAPDDPPEYKNSVITAFYISEKTYKKYERKYKSENQVLYNRE